MQAHARPWQTKTCIDRCRSWIVRNWRQHVALLQPDKNDVSVARRNAMSPLLAPAMKQAQLVHDLTPESFDPRSGLLVHRSSPRIAESPKMKAARFIAIGRR